MFRAAKEHAYEVDTKLGLLRKKTAQYACGFIQQDPSKHEKAGRFIAENQTALKDIRTRSAEFIQGTEQLEHLLREADETADEVFARLSEIYANCGLEMPRIADEDLPTGIPLERLTLTEEPTEASLATDTQDVTNCSDSISTTELDEEFASNVFLTRPSDSGGPPIWTPMIKKKN